MTDFQTLLACLVAGIGVICLIAIGLARLGHRMLRSTGFGWKRDGYEPIEHFKDGVP